MGLEEDLVGAHSGQRYLALFTLALRLALLLSLRVAPGRRSFQL